MPYIKAERRDGFDVHLDAMAVPENKGDLEYCLYKLLVKYMSTREKNYSNLHDAVYAAAHVSDEFRRRYLDKREDVAQETNGDIV